MVDRQMMSEVGPVFIRSCLAQANFECDDIVTIDRYEPDALVICWPIYVVQMVSAGNSLRSGLCLPALTGPKKARWGLVSLLGGATVNLAGGSEPWGVAQAASRTASPSCALKSGQGGVVK